MRGSALRAVLLAVAAVLAGASAAPAATAPPLQALKVEQEIHLQLPDGVTLSPTRPAPKVAPDGAHLYFSVVAGGAEQVAVSALDGSGYRCVTCGVAKTAQKARIFGDGTRLWFANTAGASANGNPLSGGTGDFAWRILECAPSVYDCAQKQVLKVRFPRDGLAKGAQNREAKPDDFGEYVGWNEVRTEDGPHVSVGRLVRRDGSYHVTEQRIVNPPYRLTSDVRDWEAAGRWYEGTEFVGGNRYLKYQTTTTGLNYDVYLLDLQTGERRQVTTDMDYNEVGRFADDGRWLYYSSARGLDRMDVFTQLPRPSLIDNAAFAQMGRVSLWNNRECMNEGWLMDQQSGQTLGGYAGQPVILEEGWRIEEWDWLPGGNRAVVTEERTGTPESRIRIVSLPAVAPAPALEPRHLDDTGYRRVTIPASQYHGITGRQVLGRRISGKGGGYIAATYLGVYFGGAWRVDYNRYSEDGKTFLTGTERIDVTNPLFQSRWRANLKMTGAHKGSMTGDITIGAQNRWRGTVKSTYDGVTRTGVPQQADCPGRAQPRLRADVTERTALGDGRERVRVHVDTQVAEDAERRPVQAATVTATDGGDAAATDASGDAVLVVPSGTGVRAQAGGFAPSA